MPLVRGRDWALAGDCMVAGLVDQLGTTGVIVGLPRHLVFLPDNTLAGAGTMVMAVPQSFLHLDPVRAVETIAAQPGLELPQFHGLLMRLASSTRDAIVLDLMGDVTALRVKDGFLRRGVYYRRPAQSGWRGFSCSKAGARELAALWASMLRE